MKYILIIICSLFFLSACATAQSPSDKENNIQKEQVNENIKESKDESQGEKKEEQQGSVDEDIDYTKFFMPDNSTSYFLGEGNEYATFNVHTKWLSDRFVALVENNGGAVMLRIYKVMDEFNKIDKIYDEMIEDLPNNVQYPSVDELNSLPAIETYLNGPIEVGTTIGKWKITEVDMTLDTPYQTFEHVFVLEETSENYINRKYFAFGYGEIKRESIMHNEDAEDFIVTSTLENIETAK